MAIASSTIISERTQINGKVRTIELHVTDAGTKVFIEYDRASGTDKNAVLTAHAVKVWNQVINRECALFIQADIPPIFKDTNKSILAAWFREAYRNLEKDELVPYAQWILNRIAGGDFTDAQVQAAFGLTAAQWTTLKDKMQTFIDARNTLDAAVGE